MHEDVSQVVQRVVSSMRVADILDILVVSALVYAVLVSLRRAQSRFVALGVSAAVILYFVARTLDMYFTLLIYQVVLTVAVVALVVIFQEDIRRAFERLALGAAFRARTLAARPTTVSAVIEAAKQFTRHKVGALIVFKGREPLERHLNGGVVLNGRLSHALLRSIFDSSSPGHDGAVIVGGDLVEKFAVHLPLAQVHDARRGTRHAAALGISELSDAFVVVVSEERGTTSVAHRGQLKDVDIGELEQRLSAFVARLKPPTKGRGHLAHLFRDLPLKLVAVVLACAGWLTIIGNQGETMSRTFAVPVAYRNVPDDWVLSEPQPHEIRLTLSGAERAFRVLEPNALTVSLDVDHLESGTQLVRVSESDLELPRDLQVQAIEPSAVQFTAFRTLTLDLPVKAVTRGSPPPGLKLDALEVKPSSVRVIVPRNQRSALTHIRTHPIQLDELNRGTTLSMRLVLPEGVRLGENTPNEVKVKVELSKTETRLPGEAPEAAPSAAPPNAPTDSE